MKVAMPQWILAGKNERRLSRPLHADRRGRIEKSKDKQLRRPDAIQEALCCGAEELLTDEFQTVEIPCLTHTPYCERQLRHCCAAVPMAQIGPRDERFHNLADKLFVDLAADQTQDFAPIIIPGVELKELFQAGLTE